MLPHTRLHLLLPYEINLALLLMINIRPDIGIGLLDIVRDIERIPRGFRDRDAVVQRKDGRHGAEADDDAPGAIAGELAAHVAAGEGTGGVDEGVAEGECYD